MNIDAGAIKELIKRPIAFHPLFARVSGSVTAGLMLSQLYYWADRDKDFNKWQFRTQAQWEDETSLTRHEQQSAAKRLLDLKVIEVERLGKGRKNHYRIVEKIFFKILFQSAKQVSRKAANQIQVSRKAVNRIPVDRKAVDRNSALGSAGKRLTKPGRYIGTRAETTEETTSKGNNPYPSVPEGVRVETQQVMRDCHFTDNRLAPIIAKALEEYAKVAQVDIADAARLMIRNHEDFIKLGPYLRYRWGERRWIQHGHWVNVDGWPLDRAKLDQERHMQVGRLQ